MQKAIMTAMVMVLLVAGPALAWDTFNSGGGINSWESSPNNWDNSPQNWDNNPNNWKNSPDNWDNSPQKWGNDRIIRDNQGRARGYVVPKSSGGLNVFSLDGERQGYVPD